MSVLALLTFGAALTAIAGATCSLKAGSIKNERDQLYDMLETSVGARPDNTAGDAMTYALLGREDARLAAKSAADAAPWNTGAAVLAIASALLSLAAGLIALA